MHVVLTAVFFWAPSSNYKKFIQVYFFIFLNLQLSFLECRVYVVSSGSRVVISRLTILRKKRCDWRFYL